MEETAYVTTLYLVIPGTEAGRQGTEGRGLQCELLIVQLASLNTQVGKLEPGTVC